MRRSVLCPVLVGRDRELLGLRTALDDAKTGRGGVALVTGEAGVGKSRLVKDLEAVARQDGWTVLSGRGAGGQTQLPFRALIEAFCSAFRASGPPDAPELVPFRRVLGQLVPEWRQEGSVRNDDFLVVLGEAVLRLLRVMTGAGGRCLFLLEDLHWADPDTVAVLEYLADNLDTAPVLCLGTLRSDQPSPALGLASSLSARRVGPVFVLERLGAADTTRMARACLDATSLPDELEAALWNWTEGIPFLVEELLSAWTGSGALSPGASGWLLQASVVPVVPDGFAETVCLRLQDLGTDGQGVLSAAATLGREFDVDLLPTMTGLEAPAVLRVLRGGVGAHLLRCETSPERPAFSFRHALIGKVVLGQLLPPEQLELYRRALSAVEEAHPDLPDEWCERAAGLAEHAGHPGRAARLLLESGLRALDRGALTTAEDALERAATLAGDAPSLAVEIDEALTEVLVSAAKTDRAVEVGTRFLSALPGPTGLAPSRRAAVHLRLARVLLPSGDWAEVSSHLQSARQLAEEGME
ncbi:MAG: AAA family ATPase, partial [Actinomycetota bacterium]|nr:AAA family ATPase [Actinomycetota bacterium]